MGMNLFQKKCPGNRGFPGRVGFVAFFFSLCTSDTPNSWPLPWAPLFQDERLFPRDICKHPTFGLVEATGPGIGSPCLSCPTLIYAKNYSFCIFFLSRKYSWPSGEERLWNEKSSEAKSTPFRRLLQNSGVLFQSHHNLLDMSSLEKTIEIPLASGREPWEIHGLSATGWAEGWRQGVKKFLPRSSKNGSSTRRGDEELN